MISFSKIIKTLLFLTLTINVSINGQTSFEKADSIAKNITNPFDNVEELANKLTEDLSTDIEKARVFYMWIAKNVRYDCRKFHKKEKPKFRAMNEEDFKKQLKRWHEKQIQITIKKKRGICGDYSRLFKALCDEVGIEAVVITGDSRDFYKPYRNNHDNPHAWNAVKVNGKWNLLDCTWAAGYTDEGVTKFRRKISLGFFFTPIKWFAQNHFPDDEKWQLLENPISKKEFSKQPLINYGQEKYLIKDFSSKVQESKSDKNKKEIWIEFENAPKAIMVLNKKRKRVNFERIEKEGKTILKFSKTSARNITVFGSKSLRSRMDWIARFQL